MKEVDLDFVDDVRFGREVSAGLKDTRVWEGLMHNGWGR